jgi:hypothetical protein
VDRRRRIRQEAMDVVPADQVEADGAKLVAVEQDVRGATEADPVQPHGEGEQSVGANRIHG